MWHNFFPEFSSFPEERLELSGGRTDVGGQADEFDVSKVAVPPAGYCVAGRAVVFVSLWELWQSHSLSHCDGPMRMETRPEGGNSHTSPQTLWLFAVQALQILALVSARLGNPSQTDSSEFPPGINVCLHSHILWPCFYLVCPMWLIRTQLECKEKHAYDTKLNLRWDHWWMWIQRLYGNSLIGNRNLCFVLFY